MSCIPPVLEPASIRLLIHEEGETGAVPSVAAILDPYASSIPLVERVVLSKS